MGLMDVDLRLMWMEVNAVLIGRVLIGFVFIFNDFEQELFEALELCSLFNRLLHLELKLDLSHYRVNS